MPGTRYHLIANVVETRVDESTKFTAKLATKGTGPALGIFDLRGPASGVRYPASGNWYPVFTS